MEDEKVVPTVQELAGFDLNNTTIIELIHQAQESDAVE
jgi:SP family general alpha glucoside:H+ symporter-like MFS transporter